MRIRICNTGVYPFLYCIYCFRTDTNCDWKARLQTPLSADRRTKNSHPWLISWHIGRQMIQVYDQHQDHHPTATWAQLPGEYLAGPTVAMQADQWRRLLYTICVGLSIGMRACFMGGGGVPKKQPIVGGHTSTTLGPAFLDLLGQ